METNENKLIIKFANIFLGIIFFAMYIMFYNDYTTNFIINAELVKFILSWIGIILYIYIIFSWYKLHGKIFDLYTIMVTFFILLNYGQCFLWAFGIHTDDEIGKSNLYGVGIATDKEIIIAQLITLMCIFMFHVGSCFCNEKEKGISSEKNERNKRSIYVVSLCLSFFVIPISFIQYFINLLNTQSQGYGSLFYNDLTVGETLIEIFSRLFAPCLFGLLIGSGFKKNVNKVVGIIMLAYIILSLASGDRGNWLYALLILLFLYNNYIKKIKLKSFLKLIIIGIVCLTVINAIVSVRNTGITFQNISKALSIGNNPVVTTVFEMGTTMGIQTTLVRTGFDIYPYGNTHFFSILGMVSDKVIEILGFDYVDLSTWFTKQYLKLDNWGPDFSIVGENLINYGPYFAPIAMIIIGWIFTKLVYLSNKDLEGNSLKTLVALISCLSLISIFRGAMSFHLKVWLFRIIIFVGLIKIYTMYINSKNIKKV